MRLYSPYGLLGDRAKQVYTEIFFQSHFDEQSLQRSPESHSVEQSSEHPDEQSLQRSPESNSDEQFPQRSLEGHFAD